MSEAIVQSFFAEPSAKILALIDYNFLTDSFNNYGLMGIVSHYQDAYRLLLEKSKPPNSNSKDDSSSESASSSSVNSQDNSTTVVISDEIEKAARQLYGLIHSRYIQKERGLKQMFNKYKNGDFPKCPRYYCKSCLLPFGETATLAESLKWFCPICNDVYDLNRIYTDEFIYKDIDGAYFGPNWIYLFQQKFQDQFSVKEPMKLYVPKLFGFKIAHPEDGESESCS